MPDPIARKVQIYGRVQGVFFRQWAVHQARDLGVSGWVRNRQDGSVEAHVEGAPATVEKMIERLRGGPSGARVEDVRLHNVDTCDSEVFEVRH